MVDHALLLKDLQGQVKLLEQDLRERSEDPTAIAGTGPDGTPETFAEALDREYQRARKAERTDATYGAWRDDQVTQAAVAWVLATVFVRFCEDNELLEYPFIAGPRDGDDRYAQAMEFRDAWILEGRRENPDAPERTDRDWLEHAFAEMSVSSVMAGLFSREYNPMWKITPSHQAAQALIDFWRTVGDDGHLVHDFRDPEWNTRFLGDLYQDLSEATRKKYALLQTPEFVEEFILDYTLEPAVEEFGLDGKRIYQEDDQGFRLIDPTCGSGHFLLGAFHRLLEKWREAEPGASDWDLISRALKSVHGVDKNPYAVAIARFRLMVAAMKEGEIYRLSESNPEWPIVVAAGDSLIHGSGEQEELFPERNAHHYETEDVYPYIDQFQLLGVGSYHSVVGNPPYVTVKDKKEKEFYKSRYESCSGAYALSAPFSERFFNLAVRGTGERGGAGYVGKITANSFMKREFGKKLIEQFFRNRVRLTHIIDTSGAYIPGHGTPTVIIIGRNMTASHKAKIRAIMGISGEPQEPENPAEGLVWNAICNQVDNPGSESDWISCSDFSWMSFNSHPWSLSGGRASALMEVITGEREVLGAKVENIGFCAVTRLDDAYMLGEEVLRRMGVSENNMRSLVAGDDVRDWSVNDGMGGIFPYSAGTLAPEIDSSTEKILWAYRQLLRDRRALSGNQEEQGLEWYEYSSFNRIRYDSMNLISFAFVSTHNHFALRKGSEVFIRSAPVMMLPHKVSREECMDLLSALNSSVGCFWLKQVCHDKGSQSGTGGFMHDEWERFYEFTASKLKNFPLPVKTAQSIASELDTLARQISVHDPRILVKKTKPSDEVFGYAESQHTSIRQRMIALQEELDWLNYGSYGVLVSEGDLDGVVSKTEQMPGVKPGERAFEIILARKMFRGEASSVWFARHGADLVTEIPNHWPDSYKRVIEKRIEVIESNDLIRLLERPEYKRRWKEGEWNKKLQEAIGAWILEKCEDRNVWFYVDDFNEERPSLFSLRALCNRVRDFFPEVVDVAALYDPEKDFFSVVSDIITAEHVPYLSALRYKESGLRKRADWEHVWHLQVEEDRLNSNLEDGGEEHRLDTPLPPKYTSADFRQSSFWRNRGKLDVPKERFISYEGAETDEDPTLILGWAGWNHAEQADALASLAFERIEQGWRDDAEKMTPLLAGIAELLPWVRQWHSEPDETGESPADIVEEDLKQLREETGITDSDMKNWRPTASGRGKRKNK
ncbi:BREX-2 system adenine-specific DNA-methyltransferase PglX [Nocardiopsis suaedae]|uniref:site-specific DNA-methyltransferase (adenine-specific) n=1 Tax=Nocardiopsis suaedae TaxID=3018444 RepID=A0ABT4TQI2_9ACTN|nr:BREX-2 system adenine-specific DNA-methyltransferase PglX [Nocardiopsis suaedae]MDA2806631.1 BREX-2 system adenine-specific DNA-methyltransferase PglX [Nocardiopsis suaedae]